MSNKYCPNCYNKPEYIDAATFAPVCECGWKGNMIDLLSEKEALIKSRKKKIKNIENK